MPGLPTEAENNVRRFVKTMVQVLLLVVLVPLGVVLVWVLQSPSLENLAAHAARGADSAALLELVNRSGEQPGAEYQLRDLLRRDAGALRALVSLAASHEAAMHYLISIARTQPDSLVPLADYEMSYPFALSLLQHMDAKGMPRLRAQAAHGANAQFMMGVAYEQGCHVPQSWLLAAEWYGRALAQGYSPAAPRYSFVAYNAAMETENAEAAARLFRAAAEHNHPAAQCALGVCYSTGKGVPVDFNAAFQWYMKSAEQEYSDAQYNLGWCYLHGEGVKAEPEQAVAWFTKAAFQGDALAQYYVGRAYELGEGVDCNYETAIYWYRCAVAQENDSAQCALGHCYAQGRGVPQDLTRAVYMYKHAAAQGNKEAQCALECYRKRDGGAARVDCEKNCSDRKS